MHRTVRDDDKGARYHSESDDIAPVGLCIKSKGTQDRCTRDFNIQTVLVINQSEERHFIDDQGLEAIMENG